MKRSSSISKHNIEKKTPEISGDELKAHKLGNSLIYASC